METDYVLEISYMPLEHLKDDVHSLFSDNRPFYSVDLVEGKYGYEGENRIFEDFLVSSDKLYNIEQALDKYGISYVEKTADYRTESDDVALSQYILEIVDTLPWNYVHDYEKICYMKAAPERFKSYIDILEKQGYKLDGTILDVASGPASIGTVIDNVTAYDISPEFIKSVRELGIKGVVGKMEEIPFEDNSFDYVFTAYPPMKVENPEISLPGFFDKALDIARKQVVIFSPPLQSHLPEELQERVIFKDGPLMILDAEGYSH